MEDLHTAWTTSSYYTKELPQWVTLYNRNESNQTYMIKRWELLLPYDDYHNSQVSCIEGLKSKNNKRIILIGEEPSTVKTTLNEAYDQMCYTPAGNNAVFAFAKHIISNNEMGKDESIDMLNIVLDTPTKICQRFGPESVEYEDMLYRLDRNIEELLSFLSAQVTDPSQIVITLTAAHGNHDLLRPIIQFKPAGKIVGNGLTQFQETGIGGVVREPFFQRTDAFFTNRPRRSEIRLADS